MGEGFFIVNYIKEMASLIGELGQRHGRWEVFNDFITMSAISISNSVDHREVRQEREDEYLEIVKRYTPDEMNKICKILGLLVLELERNVEAPKDVLGEMFMELGLNTQWKGQVFTPASVCELMGEIVGGGNHLQNEIDKNGYISLQEPCIGSGNIVAGVCRAMAKAGFDYTKQLVVVGVDIDIRCVYMSYIQLSLMGVPAVIIHGNTLSLETWGCDWHTPIYVLDGWWRKFPKNQREQVVQITKTPEQIVTSHVITADGQLRMEME